MHDILPWLVLKSVPGVGNLLFNRLIRQFLTPDAVMAASVENLTAVKGITPRIAHAITHHTCPDAVKADLDTANHHNFHILTLADAAYPRLLREIADPPPVLYVHGSVKHINPCIAMVGTRGPTQYGISMAIRLSRGLASAGITVVSGMARGIDTCAHNGALAVNGRTVAVLGSGLCRIYPAQNQDLFHRIAETGAVISEFACTASPEAHHFPIRNRVISGICLGTVVVEANKKSGSLITARLAGEQNREVFAVPGSAFSAKSDGSHRLIKAGAKLVTEVPDIIEELAVHLLAVAQSPVKACQDAAVKNEKDKTTPQRGAADLSASEQAVCSVLSPYPMHVDEVAAKTGMDCGKLSGILLSLELKRVVTKEPGNLYSRYD